DIEAMQSEYDDLIKDMETTTSVGFTGMSADISAFSFEGLNKKRICTLWYRFFMLWVMWDLFH
ncbi:MAG: hypothetical protein SVM86_06225, partial [Candidatus Cloacimonadota bacterium]|nr:hypothetical protein [Candidatus Cloacimonadota bacterium]